MREEENIEALSRAILRDAQAEAEQIQTEARTKADLIRQSAHRQADSESRAVLERARAEAERLRSQVVASAQLKARTLQLEHREKLLDGVFAAARQRLASIQKRSDYDQIATQLLREALVQLKAERAEVRADDATAGSLKTQALEQLSRELKAHIVLGAALPDGLGVIVDASDGRLHYDNTLQSRLIRMQAALRSSVYQVLMGEKR